MSKGRPITTKKPFPAVVTEWMKAHFTVEQQVVLKQLALYFMAMNSEEKQAAQALEFAFTGREEVKDGKGPGNEPVSSESRPE
jgi:hypothetical protein